MLLPVVRFNVFTGIRFSLRDKRFFEISEVEITGVDCNIKPVVRNFSLLNLISIVFILFSGFFYTAFIPFNVLTTKFPAFLYIMKPNTIEYITLDKQDFLSSHRKHIL